jgi:hypothetical protein
LNALKYWVAEEAASYELVNFDNGDSLFKILELPVLSNGPELESPLHDLLITAKTKDL